MQRAVAARILMLAASFALLAPAQVNGKGTIMEYPTFYRTKQIDRRDVPKAEIHIVDGGHFALDTEADEIAALVRTFMK